MPRRQDSVAIVGLPHAAGGHWPQNIPPRSVRDSGACGYSVSSPAFAEVLVWGATLTC